MPLDRKFARVPAGVWRCALGVMGCASLFVNVGCQQARYGHEASATCLSTLSTLAPIMASGGPPRLCAPAGGDALRSASVPRVKPAGAAEGERLMAVR